MQPLRIHIGGIKCDNPECDFNDMSVLFNDYSKWLNKSCPKCGSNLLTQQDFDTVKVLMYLTEIVNEVIPETKDDEEIFRMSACFDGTGRVTFSELFPFGEPDRTKRVDGLVIPMAEEDKVRDREQIRRYMEEHIVIQKGYTDYLLGKHKEE